MNKFEFKSNNIEMEIDGKVYAIKYDNETPQIVKSVGEATRKIADELSATKDIDGACMRLDYQINKLLGEGTTMAIFDGRAANIFERIDVLNFIANEIKSFSGNV